MADSPLHPDSKGDTADGTGVSPDHGSTTGTPRWVKVFGIIALVLVLLLVILLLTRGPGGHGPDRHTGSGDTGVTDDRLAVKLVAAHRQWGMPIHPKP